MSDIRNVAIYRHQLFKLSESFVAQQALALRAYHPVFVGRVQAGEAPSAADVITAMAAPTRRARCSIVWHALTRDCRAFLRRLTDRNIAIVHAHFGFDGVYAIKLARALGVPLVTTFHGFDATCSRSTLLLSARPSLLNYALFHGALARQGTLFVCVSEFIRKRVIAQGFPAGRTVTHYIGIDTAAILPASQAAAERYVLHVGRLVEKKGTADLICAFSQLAHQVPDVHLMIIGDGPLRNALQDLAREKGVEKRVRFLGPLSHQEVLHWMERASVFCLPSVTARSGDAEGLPIVLLEAAAKAVPVVATEHAGIPELVQNERTGFLVPEHSAAQLAERLRWLLDNEALRTEMGRAGRKVVEERFDIGRQARKLEALYDSVL